MAKEFKKLAAEWKACEAKMATQWGELDSAAQTDKNTKDLLEGACEDLLEKVFSARRGGASGKKLSDFMADADVKKAWAEIQKILKTLEAAHNRYEGACRKFGPLHAEATKIATTADAEVKERKKKIFDSKSIPDLEKLSKEINTYLTTDAKSHMRSVTDLAKQKPVKFTRDAMTLKIIDRDIASGINSIKVDADDSTLLREFAPRSLAVAASRMNDRKKAATAFCVEALSAVKEKDREKATKALNKAIGLAGEAQEISEHYAKTLKKKGDEIKSHKDGKEMLKRVSKINETVTAIVSTVAKTQKAVG